MVISPHHLPAHSLTYVPEPTDKQLNEALLRLWARGDDRNAQYAKVRKAGKERVKTAMRIARPPLNPSIDKAKDWLGIVQIHFPDRQTDAKEAVCFAFNAKALPMFRECYRSLKRHNPDLTVVVLAVDDGAYQGLQDYPEIILVRCTPEAGNWAPQWLAGVNVCAPRLFPSVERWLMMECDMLIHGDLSEAFKADVADYAPLLHPNNLAYLDPLSAASSIDKTLTQESQKESGSTPNLTALPESRLQESLSTKKPLEERRLSCSHCSSLGKPMSTKIYGVRPHAPLGQQPMDSYLPNCGGFEGEQEWITGRTFPASLIFNGGVLIGHRDAFLALEAKLRSYWPYSRLHCEGIHGHWGDECIKILGIEDLGMAQKVDGTYNRQLYHMTDERKPCLIEHFATESKGLFWEVSKTL